jgi:hypothetical protein
MLMRVANTEELEVFAEFCHACGLSSATFSFVDAPDFVCGDESIGVELVAYHRDATTSSSFGSLRRLQESQLDKLLASTKRRYFASSSMPLDVFVFPSHRQTPPPEDAPERFLELIFARGRGEDSEVPHALRGVIDEVTVAASQRSPEKCLWQVARADFVDVRIPAIQAHLDAKEVRLPKYREKARSVWLLIHGAAMPFIGSPDVGRWSGYGRITEALRGTRFLTSFDRVFYLDRHTNTCLELERAPN